MANLPAGADAFIAAQRAAAIGQYICRGPCKREGNLNDAIVIGWNGAIAFAICTDCLKNVNVQIKRDIDGIQILLTKPNNLIIAPL